MEQDFIVVSVIVAAYNQEEFIAKALDSILAQETNFKFEIIINDDCSTDTTFSICESISLKNKRVIRLKKQSKNVGLIANYLDLINNAIGKYIAILEGDDYWVDVHKLQKQYDFLESKNDFGMVHTNCKVFYQTDDIYKIGNQDASKIKSGDIFERIFNQNFIYAVTAFFRKDLVAHELLENQKCLLKFKTIDYFLWLVISLKTKIGYIDDVTAIYRVHDLSISNSSDFNKKLDFSQSTFAIKKYFVDKASWVSEETLEQNYYWNMCMLSLTHFQSSFSVETVNLKRIQSPFISLYLRFKILRVLAIIGYKFLYKLKNYRGNRT